MMLVKGMDGTCKCCADTSACIFGVTREAACSHLPVRLRPRFYYVHRQLMLRVMLVAFRQDALHQLPAACTNNDALEGLCAESAATAPPASQLTNSVALGVSPAASKVSVLSLPQL